MKNEPVAWMLVTGHGTKIVEKKPYCAVDYWKPLYLHPAKTLTDEEILEIAQSYDWQDGNSNWEVEILFAKECIRKAQEK